MTSHEEESTDESEEESAQRHESEKPRSKKLLIIVGAVVVVLAIVGFFVWFARRNEVSTDDAYTDDNVVTMVPKVSGYVVALNIDDNVHVRKGDLLVRIDPRDFRTAKQQAEASLELARAQLQSAPRQPNNTCASSSAKPLTACLPRAVSIGRR